MDNFQQYSGIEIEKNENDVEEKLELLKRDGHFLLPSVIGKDELEIFSKKIDQEWENQVSKYGEDLLKKIGDWGTIRAMMEHEANFQQLIVHPEILKYVDATVGKSAILHLQNGVVLHPKENHNQARYHKDFPRDFLTSTILSINAFIAIDDFTTETGGTWLVPGSHRFTEMPSSEYIENSQIQILCPAGSILIFDSMLWHKGGWNQTQSPRRAVNQQYTRAFIKQQLDYPVFMRDKVDMESRLAQILGLWAIPPKSVEQYRVTDPKMRTYRGGQS